MTKTASARPQPRCSSCGSTDREDVGAEVLRENDGYTTCCNEPVED